MLFRDVDLMRAPPSSLPARQSLFRRGPVERKALLRHITLTVHPGDVAYVMGPSGAG
jgi:ABC-type multidrug transport system ATPase subunit